MIDLISLVEDDPDFVLVSVDGLDRPPELVRDVQLVGVEQEDDPEQKFVLLCGPGFESHDGQKVRPDWANFFLLGNLFEGVHFLLVNFMGKFFKACILLGQIFVGFRQKNSNHLVTLFLSLLLLQKG